MEKYTECKQTKLTTTSIKIISLSVLSLNTLKREGINILKARSSLRRFVEKQLAPFVIKDESS